MGRFTSFQYGFDTIIDWIFNPLNLNNLRKMFIHT